VLSATLTTDISKLNSLRLSNPKLVVIGAPEAENKEETSDMRDAETKFTLPSTLKEFSVSVGDGSEKPLQLLYLLLDHIKIEAGAKMDGKNCADSETSSHTDESSSVSSDAHSTSDSDSSSSSSESDSESDSESSSDGDSTDSSSDNESESNTSDHDPKTKRNTVLVFTKSSEAAARLTRLLCLMYPSLSDRIGTIVKSNKSSASRKTLRAYRAGTVSIIVATDRAARGLDLQSLTHVVNYDMPASVTTYVHRVGRTARAGKDGTAWTLVAHREGRWFSNEIVKGSDGKIVREDAVGKVTMKMDTDKERLQTMKRDYEAALEELANEVSRDGKNSRVKK
jgi:ATP-dependent RNA helicase DDX51/DBP6